MFFEKRHIRHLVLVSNPQQVIVWDIKPGTYRLLGRSLLDDETVPIMGGGLRFLSDTVRQTAMSEAVEVQEEPAQVDHDYFDHFERGADIIIGDRALSKIHAIFYNDEGHLWAVDMGSRNGLFVNNDRIGTKLLEMGDILSVGTTKLRVE